MPRQMRPLPTIEAFIDQTSAADLGTVTRCHAALEVALNHAVSGIVPEGRSRLTGLPFMTRVDLAIAFGRVPDFLRESFFLANELRNRFAHSYDATVTEEDAKRLLDTFTPDTFDGMLFRSWRAALSEPPLQQVAFAFATLFVLTSTYAGMYSEMIGKTPNDGSDDDVQGD